MRKEDDDKNYYIFLGILALSLLGGAYFVLNLLFSINSFTVLNDLLSELIPGQNKAQTESVVDSSVNVANYDAKVLATTTFMELKLYDRYEFSSSTITSGKPIPFENAIIKKKEKKESK